MSVAELFAGEYVVNQNRAANMRKISFAAYVTSDSVQMVKLYPEQNIQVRFARRGHGSIYVYCNRYGFVKYKL